jgi:hypothetical protein
MFMQSPGKGALWTGRTLSLLAALPFVISGAMKLLGRPEVAQGFEHFGWPATSIALIATLELGSVILYLIPPLAVLGGIMLTGFLGGAIATHLRLGEPVYLHMVIGFLIWMGLFLREPRLRVLIPVRGKDCTFERSIEINQPVGVVFPYLRSLENFKNWNPFLKSEPNAGQSSRGTDGQVGFVGAWDGKKVGAGEQEIMRIIDNKQIDFELRFKRPFVATNEARFAVESTANGKSKVTWRMAGTSVFPMTVFSLFMNPEKMMGGMFDSGLKDLKTILEKR